MNKNQLNISLKGFSSQKPPFKFIIFTQTGKGVLMINQPSHWLFPRNIEEACAAQKEIAHQVQLQDNFKESICYIGGLDVSNNPFDPNRQLFAAATLLSYPECSLIESSTAQDTALFPYISGLLGFREAPLLIKAYEKLSHKPDLIMVDGHGVSHPRGLGIASHLGVLLNIPTIGVAKSILIGSTKTSLPEEPGSMLPLLWKGQEIARVIRTKKRCLPLIVSAGHKISLETAVSLVMSCLKQYKLPEPTRQAHLSSNHARKKFLEK